MPDVCFNGATRLHAWKPCFLLFHSSRFSCFNGATRLHAWKRRVLRCFVARFLGFNGATRLHAWKPPHPRNQQRKQERLQWSHASSRVETSANSKPNGGHHNGFNGATRLHAWKPPTVPLAESDISGFNGA